MALQEYWAQEYAKSKKRKLELEQETQSLEKHLCQLHYNLHHPVVCALGGYLDKSILQIISLYCTMDYCLKCEKWHFCFFPDKCFAYPYIREHADPLNTIPFKNGYLLYFDIPQDETAQEQLEYILNEIQSHSKHAPECIISPRFPHTYAIQWKEK